MPSTIGPYIQTACFCEKVLEEQTGIKSLIRVIDTVTHVEVGSFSPIKMPTVVFSSNLVLMLKSGKAKGRFNLEIIHELPNGKIVDNDTIRTEASFLGGNHGFYVVVQLITTLEVEGVHWFNVKLDGKEITAVPLAVQYHREQQVQH